MRLAGQGVEDVGEEERVDVPAGRGVGEAEAIECGVRREVLDEDGQPSERELAAVEVAEGDAMEPGEVRFDGVARLLATEPGGELG